MATAIPTQLYEKVSEVEALSRNDQLDGRMFYQVPQEEALSRNPRSRECEKRCRYIEYCVKTFVGVCGHSKVCDWYCPRN